MKPQQILDLEKYWHIKIREGGYGVSEIGKITILDLSGNDISSLFPLSELKDLGYLFLANNEIVRLSPLSGLKGLKNLDLENNQIADLSTLSELKRLMRVDLANNKITDIPYWVIEQGYDLAYEEHYLSIQSEKFINLYNNPLQNPPTEIILEGMDSVRAWYAEKNKAEQGGESLKKLDEVRVIILGEGKVGKTTLKKRLLGIEIPEVETQTDGIDISIYKPKELQGISLRLWDFGGQEIQHSVHKLFLEENCVYVLVLDKRQDQQTNGTLQYWLNHIRSFGKNAPILIVENQIDADKKLGITANTTATEIATLIQLNGQIKEYYHREESPIDFVGISAKEGYNFDTFKEKLWVLARQQNNEGNYPQDWLKAKNEVELQITGGTETAGLAHHNYISKETFDLVCRQAGVAEDAYETILKIMLRLGVAFYFKPKENRTNWLILNPEWITVGIYSLILDKKVQKLNGRLLKIDLENILIQQAESQTFFSQKKDYSFKIEELDYILGLMQDNELCYSPDGIEYFLPMGFKQNFTSTFPKKDSAVSAFFFEYDTLPTAIWYKFLVRLFKRKIVSRYWDYGIEVNSKNAFGLVEFLTINQKKIKIWINGEGSIELLTLLRYELDWINEEFSNITVTPKVYAEDGNEIKYVDLLSSFHRKEQKISVGFANEYLVKSLLEKIELLDYTIQNTNKELAKVNKNYENFVRDFTRELKDANNVNININTNTNTNTNETRLELPRESNALEGKLAVLLEELQKKQSPEAEKVAEVLSTIQELREIPTVEKAQRKGYLEKFKKFGEWFKTGSDTAKSIKELADYVDIEQIKQGIEQIQQTIQTMP